MTPLTYMPARFLKPGPITDKREKDTTMTKDTDNQTEPETPKLFIEPAENGGFTVHGSTEYGIRPPIMGAYSCAVDLIEDMPELLGLDGISAAAFTEDDTLPANMFVDEGWIRDDEPDAEYIMRVQADDTHSELRLLSRGKSLDEREKALDDWAKQILRSEDEVCELRAKAQRQYDTNWHRERELDRREKDLDERKARLNKRETHLDARECEVSRREEAMNLRELGMPGPVMLCQADQAEPTIEYEPTEREKQVFEKLLLKVGNGATFKTRRNLDDAI